MTDIISKERVIENAQNIYDMFVSNYGFSSVLALDMKTVLDSLRTALAQQSDQGWRDIETAPKSKPSNPEHRLIFWLDGVGPAFGYAYDNGVGGLLTLVDGYSGRGWEPTHWQPMLAAPKGGV